MIDLLKDRYKLGLLMATLFLTGVVVSAYQIYRLPHNLMLGSMNHPALSPVYVTLAVTFFIGAITIWAALNQRNEVIVFRDKQTDQQAAVNNTSDSGKTTISLDTVNQNLRQATGEKNILQAGLQAICKQLEAGQGAIYLLQETEGRRVLELKSGYALSIGENTVITYEMGEGLIGQSAASAKTLYIDDVPEGYVKILSGLGSASPRYLLITAMKQQDRVFGVLEIASFTPLDENQRKFVEESAQLIADKIASNQA